MTCPLKVSSLKMTYPNGKHIKGYTLAINKDTLKDSGIIGGFHRRKDAEIAKETLLEELPDIDWLGPVDKLMKQLSDKGINTIDDMKKVALKNLQW